MAIGRANLGADNEEHGQRAADQKRQRTESSWACQYKYIYVRTLVQKFDPFPLQVRLGFSLGSEIPTMAPTSLLRKSDHPVLDAFNNEGSNGIFRFGRGLLFGFSFRCCST